MQALPGFGQFDAIGAAMKEGRPKMHFQQLDLPTDCSVGDVQHIRGLSQAGVVCSFVKGLKGAKVSEVFRHVRKPNSYASKTR